MAEVLTRALATTLGANKLETSGIGHGHGRLRAGDGGEGEEQASPHARHSSQLQADDDQMATSCCVLSVKRSPPLRGGAGQGDTATALPFPVLSCGQPSARMILLLNCGGRVRLHAPQGGEIVVGEWRDELQPQRAALEA